MHCKKLQFLQVIWLFSNCGGTPLEKGGFFSLLEKGYVPSGDESVFYKGFVLYLKWTVDPLFFQCFGDIFSIQKVLELFKKGCN